MDICRDSIQINYCWIFGKHFRDVPVRQILPPAEEPEEAERYQAGAQRSLAAMGSMLGMVALSIIVAAIMQ